MAHVSGERVSAFTAEELEKLVDGVVPQYTLLCGPPDKQVSAHQKNGIWRAIAKEVRTLGVFDRRSTHYCKRCEDLCRWAKKTVEVQLGLASKQGRGVRHTMTPLMFCILAVAYLELDGHLKASQPPQGANIDLFPTPPPRHSPQARVSRTQPSTSATKSPSNVDPAAPRGSKGALVREASVPPTPAKEQTIPPPAKVKKGPACSRGKDDDPPSKASSKPPADRAKGKTPSAKVRKGQKTRGKALQPTEDAGESLVPTSRTASPATCTAAAPAQAPPPAPPTAPPLPPLLSAAASPPGSRLRLKEKGWSLPPPLAAPAPAPRPAPSAVLP
ncbi:hypothetical protein NDU88_001115 [Pleurodeles waltl]|uniref:Myb/SANT-like DNA-binding domain-containing protein n=1 Tax=Pleurodeles waltl TaxID=8319 RepID=A0AAV7SZB5_PLEWA|nr:hypothetical protein NDU88_001115 [Pleurodeles waltl]